jgi:branched-subunit amino acid aminotransferase/4-amino-4-deoxychorismate lyase
MRELASASEIFLTSSLQEVVPVVWLADRALPEPALGRRMREVYRDSIASGAGN